MPQDQRFRIAPDKKLIILDAHDTLLKRDLSRDPKTPLERAEDKEKVSWFLRDGFLNFIDYFGGIKGCKLVISSDGGQKYLTEICERFGIYRQFAAIFGSGHMDLSTGLKKVDQILERTGFRAEEAVFIGDSNIDRLSAEKQGMDFIQVPTSLEDPHFSFNGFLPLNFTRDNFGLEIQKITNPKRIYPNLSTPELVEEVIRHQEAKLAHLGALVANLSPPRLRNPEDRSVGYYLVGEPYEDHEIFEGGFSDMAVEDFQGLYQRLLAFLQDREIFLQDCYLGADPKLRIPLRVISQSAWTGLWARHMLRHVPDEEMESFFPEYTLIHIPYFQAIPEFDNLKGERFLIVNQLKKIAIVGGTHSLGELEEALHGLICHQLPSSDSLSLRATTALNDQGEGSLFLGPKSLTRHRLTEGLTLLGGDLHAWSPGGLSNLEWGLSMSFRKEEFQESEFLHSNSKSFAVMIEEAGLNEQRRLMEQSDLRLTLPLPHLPNVERSGLSPHPKSLFLLLDDHKGLFDPISILNPAEVCLFWFLGLSLSEEGQASFQPLYLKPPLLDSPLRQAMMLWERLVSHQVRSFALSPKADPNWNLAEWVARLSAGETPETREDPFWGWQSLGRRQEENLDLAKETEQKIYQFLKPIWKSFPHEFRKSLGDSWSEGIAALG